MSLPTLQSLFSKLDGLLEDCNIGFVDYETDFIFALVNKVGASCQITYKNKIRTFELLCPTEMNVTCTYASLLKDMFDCYKEYYERYIEPKLDIHEFSKSMRINEDLLNSNTLVSIS